MRYTAFQAQTDLLAPARLAAAWGNMALDLGPPWLREVPPFAHVSASWEMLTRAGLTHHRRDYGFTSVRIGDEDVPVQEETVVSDAFGDLVRFRKATDPDQPRSRVAKWPDSGATSRMRG
jgi:poly(3-hydroxybutyrate) depolymerase